MKLIKSFIFVFLFLPNFIQATAPGYDQDISLAILKKFNKNLSAEFNTEYRRYFKPNYDYLHFEGYATYTPKPKGLDLGAGYRIVPGFLRTEQRFYLDLSVKGGTNKFKLTNTTGLEYRARRDTYDVFFIKDEIKLGYVLKSNKSCYLEPYIANEVLLEIKSKQAPQNWFFVGLFSKQHDNKFFVNFYYYNQVSFKSFKYPNTCQHSFVLNFTFFIPESKKTKRFEDLSYVHILS